MSALPDIMGIQNELARRSLLRFTTETFENYQVNWHHRLICENLDEFAEGKTKNMMIFLPPQTGKSQLSSRQLPCYLLGRDPNKRIAIASYNIGFARKFNRSCQRIISSNRYREIFPDTRLYEKNITTSPQGSYLRNANEFEIVGKDGSLMVAGIGTSLAGNKVDILIVDDIVKNMAEAMSPVIQKSIFEWWHSVALYRLHRDSQILFVMTRWNEEDLAGKVIKNIVEAKNKKKPYRNFKIITLKSIKEKGVVEGDKRKVGEALWEKMHPLSDLKILQMEDPVTFQALHQQDPGVQKEFRIWHNWKKIKKMPNLDYNTCFGLDWGFNSPTTLVECQHQKGKGFIKLWLYEPGLTPDEVAKKIKPIAKRKRVYCDTASPGDTKQLRTHGINAVPAARFPNSVLTQILFVKKLKMHYVGGDENLEFEMKNHQWKPGMDGKPSNEELDKHNHATKAVMYGFYTHLTRPKAGIGII